MSNNALDVINNAFIEPKQPGEKILISSRKVADLFEKRHDNIVRDIQNLQCSRDFRRLNFEGSSYFTSQGKEVVAYNMTRDGFLLLSMGFNGAKAMQWKEALIARFNVLENYYLKREGYTIQSMAKLNQRTVDYMLMSGMNKLQIKRKLTPTPAERDQDTLSELTDIFGID